MLTLQNATIKFRDQVLFTDLDLSIRENEHWAVVGPSGSGKSALLQTLAGRNFVARGKIGYAFYDRYLKRHQVKDPLFSHRRLIAYVDTRHDFKTLANTREFYYQQRFNAGYVEQAPTVDDYLKQQAGERPPGATWSVEDVCATFHLEPLLNKRLIMLSNGEARRLRIGAALLKGPLLLLLDHPLAGLDVDTRAAFEDIFQRIAASGICLVMATDPSEIPSVITHVAAMDDTRRLRAFRKQDFSIAAVGRGAELSLDVKSLHRLLNDRERARFDILVSMKNARVAYGSTVIFENINWEVRTGESWALSGPNGSGKSTLLSLINGDHPQAYANEIVLFDRKRGSGESIWDIKRKIGFMSPELHQYFSYHYTCLQVVESGFYDTIGLFSKSRPENRRIAEQWMALLGISSIKSALMRDLSTTRQRLCLLARALVKNPYLLMLDEPCLGFDSEQQRYFRGLIDRIAATGHLGIIYVTHHRESLPACVNRTLRLAWPDIL